MAFCIRCGLPLPTEAKFCPGCGRARYEVPVQPEGPPPTIHGSDGSAAEPLRPLKDVVREAEAAYVRLVLSSVGGHRANAADILGISRKNLWEKLREYGLSDDASVLTTEPPTPMLTSPLASPVVTAAPEPDQLASFQLEASAVDVIELFARSGKTTETVAKETGVPLDTIERVRAGQYPAPVSRQALAKSLNVSEDELLEAIRRRRQRRWRGHGG